MRILFWGNFGPRSRVQCPGPREQVPAHLDLQPDPHLPARAHSFLHGSPELTSLHCQAHQGVPLTLNFSFLLSSHLLCLRIYFSLSESYFSLQNPMLSLTYSQGSKRQCLPGPWQRSRGSRQGRQANRMPTSPGCPERTQSQARFGFQAAICHFYHVYGAHGECQTQVTKEVHS